MRSSSIIILNYNGKELLAEGLPSIIEAVAVAGGDHEIMVVDNASDDGSVEFVTTMFPAVRVVALDDNYRFVGGNNRGIKAAKHDIVVLLNNDMVVDKNFLSPLLDGFNDDSVFAVTSQIYFQDTGKRREETGKTGFCWDKGMMYCYHQAVDEVDAQRGYVPIVWAGGGSAAYDKKKFIKLGLFDELYLPCYVDDLDISYMAWKRGWRSVFCAASIVHHKHRATHDKQYTRQQLDLIILRHQLLFLWKNITSIRLLLSHMFFLPLHIVKQRKREKNWLMLRAGLSALGKLPQLLRSRFASRPPVVVTDRALLQQKYIGASSKYFGNRLKVLFVCPYVPCVGVHAGGARMYQIIKGLSRNHDVSVLTYVESEDEQHYVDELRQFCRKVIGIVRGQSLDEIDWFHTVPHRPLKEFSNPEMKRTLDEEVRSGLYDVIQFEYLEMGYLARDVKKYNVPLVLTNHEVQSRNIWQSIREGGLSFGDKLQLRFEWMMMLNFELRIISLFDLIITLTPAEREEIVQYQPSLPIEVHPTGVDVPYFQQYNLNHEEAHAMVFVGFYRHYPNADAMDYFCSRILPLIQSRVPDARIYIVGAEPTLKLQQLSNGKSIIVTGRVEDIRPYIGKSAVYVVPMRLGAGIRGKIMEAWAMKKPVVSTSIAASGLVVEHGKNIFIEDSPEKFASDVVMLFQNAELRRQLGEHGFATAREHYDWAGQVRKHEEIYLRLLGGPRT